MSTYIASGSLVPSTKSFARRAGVLAFTLSILTVLATAAWGYWSTLGSGTGSAVLGTLNPPTILSATATPGSGDVHVTWAAPADGANPTGYYVQRTATGGSPQDACDSSPSSLITQLSCTDESVPSGTYTYVVTSVLASWSAVSEESNPVTVSAPSKLAFTTQPSATNTSQSAFTRQPVVEVQDAAGNRVTTDTSSVTLTLTSAAGASLTCNANPLAAVAGVASFAGCKVDKAGSYTLTATDGSLTSATSASFDVSPGVANRLAFTTQPSATNTSQTAFATQPVVEVQDAFGNTVTGDTSSVTLSLTSAPAGASLTCATNPKAAVAGVATFAGCKVDKAGSYTLTATDGSLTSATSASFDVSPGVANRLAFTTQPSATNTSQTAFTTQPVVTVLDAFGNTVTGDTSSVTLALTSAPAGASLTCATNPKAAVAGVATFAGCKVDKAGSYTLTATDGSLASATSASFTVTPGAPTKLAITTQPSATNTSQTAFATQPVVEVQDAFGNTVTGDTSSVTLALTSAPAGASLSCATNPKAAVAGVATFAGCMVGKAGSYTLTATDGSLASATSNSFNVTPGTPTKLMYVASATDLTQVCTAPVTVGNGGSISPYVALADTFGNPTAFAPAASTSITITKVSGDGNAPSPNTLTVNPNASVSSGNTLLKLPVGSPADTIYTASASGLTSVSCTVKK